ncbi:MAG: hypothetical protein NT157_02360, partial [Candidatus Micrarchaeota archaeon]|nr:hypothetical protein [Candidatus Micrarchaeota archaeon]
MGRNKKQIFDTIKDILNNKDGFAYRVCKILQDGEFDRPLSSQELTRLLNDGPGRKIKATNLTALMEPLLKREIIKTKMIGGTRGRRRLWFPGWLDKSQVSTIEVSLDQVHFFSGINSWSDPNKNFPKIIKSLKGDLMIVDPYYGNGTFFVLEKFGKDRRIRFITSQLGREEQQKRDIFDNNFQRFKKEFK